jgi:hypothetical protein
MYQSLLVELKIGMHTSYKFLADSITLLCSFVSTPLVAIYFPRVVSDRSSSNSSTRHETIINYKDINHELINKSPADSVSPNCSPNASTKISLPLMRFLIKYHQARFSEGVGPG